MPIVAVHSGPWCRSSEVLDALSDRLGFQVVRTETIIELTSQRSGLPVEMLVRALAGKRALFDSLTHQWERCVAQLKATVAEVVQGDDRILFSPTLHLIPEEVAHVLKVVIVSDMKHRLELAMERDGLARADAERQIRTADREAADWSRLVTRRAPRDPRLFDLRIPIPAEPVPEAVDMICQAAAEPALVRTARSIGAARDFLLASQVSLALIEDGQTGCEVHARGSKVEIVVLQGHHPGALARTVQALRFEAREAELLNIAGTVPGVGTVTVRAGAVSSQPRPLLVDDERDYVLALSDRLRVRNIRSDTAFDGIEALKFVETNEPDVMVLDLKMPRLKGVDVLRRLKQTHPHIEVIVVTGHGTAEDERTVRELGAFDYLTKPVDIAALADLIKAASEKARAHREALSEPSAPTP